MPFRWRPDGDYVRDLPRIRRIMPFIMRRRNESIVFYEQKFDTSKMLTFLDDFRSGTGLHGTMLHLLIMEQMGRNEGVLFTTPSPRITSFYL